MRAPYYADPKKLAKLSRESSTRAILRMIERGDWQRVLIKLEKTSYRYKEILNHSGMLKELLVKFNAIRLSMRLHATVLTGNPINIQVPEGFEAQDEAIAKIRKRTNFDALLAQIARRANIEAAATLRVDLHPEYGVVLCADRNDEVLAVGPDGPDMQPTVYERRWIVERKTHNGKKKYMRVERHRAPGGVGVVEQEAYEVTTTNIYQDLSVAKMVPLEEALPQTTLQPSTPTGVGYPLITRLVCEYFDDAPEFLMGEHDLDLLDAHAAAFSRLARSMELHGTPKARVSESMVNDNGKVEITEDAIIDPEKSFEYLNNQFDFDGMMKLLNKSTSMLLTALRVSPAIVGIKLEGGAMPDTYDKLRLESTNTLARGKDSAVYFTPALERVFEIASQIDTQRPMLGYPVGPVNVQMHPQLPKDQIDMVREVGEMLDRDLPLISHREAVAKVHGDAVADDMVESINEDLDRRTAREQAAFMGTVPTGGAS